MEYIEIIAGFLAAYTSLVGVFAHIAAMTPNPHDDAIAGTLGDVSNKLWHVINVLGLNVGKAKNGP